jgi:hypothetical protein
MLAPNIEPMLDRPRARDLNGITDAREITLRALSFASWAITSSVMPSAKYSFS